ncbi:MAG TPA: hypothetical protein VEY09_02585 [Pyrinomonadaceae bacterium]|nr:hypothetical protein [Pyrinomonadaceae bacterium]
MGAPRTDGNCAEARDWRARAVAARERFAAERASLALRPIPELISLLESEDLRTRFLAEMCLRDAAGT